MTASTAPRPAVLIASYALIAGGGETFPIFLANALRVRGWPVAVLDCAYEKVEPGIRSLLTPSVPLYHLQDVADIAPLCERLEIKVVHSCHVGVDAVVASGLREIAQEYRPKHVVTLHGGYEVLDPGLLAHHLSKLLSVSHFTYTASKNLESFPKQFREMARFTRIANGVPSAPAGRRERSELGIGNDALIAMLISRAIPEKGWGVARAAVEGLRSRSGRDIHLVLIGDGPVYEEMTKETLPGWLHLLGVQRDIRSWIGIADIGLLPTTFLGESFPLVLIDFLTMGVPVIATDAGEIPYMMTSEQGVPGYVVTASEAQGLIQGFSTKLEDFLNMDQDRRADLRAAAFNASRKFDFEAMVNAYEQVYTAVMELAESAAPV